MRQMGVALLRPLLRQLSSQRVSGRGRILQTALCQGHDYLPCSKHFRARWLSTLGVDELDYARTLQNARQTLPGIQHAYINQQFEHEYETVLCYPRGISTCSEEGLVFISDSLHDRIIIMDGSGGVLDYIGSVAGFEDGPFEFARLRKPSSIIYDINQKCLYIADCENHAIRRADLSSRMLDTVYPKQDERPSLIQRWFMRALWFMQGSSRGGQKSSGEHQIVDPWHLDLAPSGHIMAATQGFEKLWMVEVDTGAVTVESDQEPAIIFKKLMESKSAELDESNLNWMHVYEMISKGLGCEGFPNLVSQVAVLKREVLIIDPGMHQVLRLDLSTGHLFAMQLSNLGLLGLPAWWFSDDDPQVPSSLEWLHRDKPEEVIATFAVQPGRCLICVDVALPRGTVLAEPVTDRCLWRQGRGSLVELSTFDGELTNQKITAAQQYLDDLYYLEDTKEGKTEDLAEDLPVPQESPSGLPFYSSVDVSLGSGEVVFDAVLYLKRAKLTGSDSTLCGSKNEFPITVASIHNGDNHVGYPPKATLTSSQKLNDFPHGAPMVKHLNFRVKCEASPDAPPTRMMLIDVQL